MGLIYKFTYELGSGEMVNMRIKFRALKHGRLLRVGRGNLSIKVRGKASLGPNNLS